MPSDQTVTVGTKWVPTIKRRSSPRPPSINDITEVQTNRFDAFGQPVLRDTPTEDAVIDAIKTHWNEGCQQMLICGRYLARAQESFRGTFSTHIVPRLPFELSVANKLAKVAIMVDKGVIPPNRLPPHYSTAHLLLTLNKTDLREAERRGLVKSDVKRQDVVEFRKEIRARRMSQAQRWEELRAKRLALLAKRDQIERELQVLEGEMAIVDAELHDDETSGAPTIEGRAERDHGSDNLPRHDRTA